MGSMKTLITVIIIIINSGLKMSVWTYVLSVESSAIESPMVLVIS